MRFFCLLVPFLLAAPPAFGQLYPCRDDQGRLFVTNRPYQLPRGCVLLGAPPPAGGSLSVVPPLEQESPAARGAMTAPSRIEQRRVARENLWRRRAEQIVERWHQARGDIYQAGRSGERRAARDSLELLRERRRALIDEVRRDGRPAMIRWIEERLGELDRQ
ncbi:MAG: hypothetical protein Tsb0017_24550 [Geothermobacteraceae bacterium]